MRFATFLVGAFAVLASAQSSDSSAAAAATTVSSAATSTSLTPAQSSEAACLKACDAGDVNCQSKCIAVPDPSGSQVNATTDCVANCDQGNGTAADNAAYGDCVQSCIGQNYFTSTGTPAETGSSGSTGTAASASATGTSGSSSSSGSDSSSSGSGTSTSTATSSSSSSSSTSNAADAIRVGVTGASLFGLLAAFMAL